MTDNLIDDELLQMMETDPDEGVWSLLEERAKETD